MVPTLIAGFYGMNASWLPFVENPKMVGLFYAIGLLGMLLVVAGIVYRKKI